MGLAERRLSSVAQQWRFAPTTAAAESIAAPEVSGGWDAITRDPAPERAARTVPWSRSAVRGLAVIVVLAVAVAGYWAWSGRPRAVAVAPDVVAVGSPIALPMPVTEPPSTTAAGTAAEGAAAPGVPAPTGDAVPAASAVPEVVVHVTGLVADPGLVRLPLGARVADAVSAAGGVTRRRAADSVNLARILVDGEQVVVGLPGGPAPAGGATAGAPTGTPQGNPLGTGQVSIDLNTATASALEDLPGVGPVLAGRIIEWRAANGSFRSVEELGEVSGIGDAILSQVRGLVRV